MRPYVIGEDLTGVSISQADVDNGSPKVGDMIARNPVNHKDQWLVAQKYFEDNIEEFSPSLSSNKSGEEPLTAEVFYRKHWNKWVSETWGDAAAIDSSFEEVRKSSQHILDAMEEYVSQSATDSYNQAIEDVLNLPKQSKADVVKSILVSDIENLRSEKK